MTTAVLLTGATGFVGMEVLARLLERGDREVVALTRAADQQGADARAVNVEGTRSAVAFARQAGARLVHVSTAFVAGRHPGTFAEDQLDGMLVDYAAATRWGKCAVTREEARARGAALAA